MAFPPGGAAQNPAHAPMSFRRLSRADLGDPSRKSTVVPDCVWQFLSTVFWPCSTLVLLSPRHICSTGAEIMLDRMQAEAHLTVRLPADLRDETRLLAKQRHWTVSDVIRFAAREYVSRARDAAPQRPLHVHQINGQPVPFYRPRADRPTLAWVDFDALMHAAGFDPAQTAIAKGIGAEGGTCGDTRMRPGALSA